MSDGKRPGLPTGWATATIGELVAGDGVFADGDWVETKDQDPLGDVRLIQLADIGDGVYLDRSSRFLTSGKAAELRCTFLERGDVLIARMPEPLGRACIFPGDPKRAVTAVDVCIVRTGSLGPDQRWLTWTINSPSFRRRIEALQRGTTRKRISRRNLGTIHLPVPSLEEQHRITGEIEKHFTRLEASVAELERTRLNLKRYRAAVLRAASEGRLVATEAELARAEGRQYELAGLLLDRILKERRARWEADQLAKMRAAGKEPKDDKWKAKYKEPLAPDTSGLPELPEGWVWASLGQVFQVFVGATPSRARPEYWNGDVPWVSSGEVSFRTIHDTRELITDLGLRNSSTGLHPPGTVLLGMIGEGKTRGQAAILGIAACNNQNSAAIRVSEAGLPADYIFRFLEGQYEQTRQIGSGNNQPALNKTRVQNIVFPVPPLAEQQRIVAEIERRLSLVDELEAVVEHSLKRADRLRQAVLKRAFEGRLVPQDPSDEPASVLLERIRAESAALAHARNSRRQRASRGDRTPKAPAPLADYRTGGPNAGE